MNDIAIRVENLGKMYRIGIEERRPDNLWQATKQLVTSPFDYLRRITRPPTEAETLWALKDVSFEVKRGEVVGIIGRNGAGKSTLLKILSRITEPTHGRAVIHGRVGSLLEVGTGFHPELTGRENIYLNGAILGMQREEIDRKFDEIVAFSGVEKFIDTPVKRYSSGMRVRLAFSVAAHLDPEILLVDEVLAVGDASFQKKCLGKMDEVAGEGRTVMLVSHNMSTIKSLCAKVILLDNGCLVSAGFSGKVISNYLETVTEGAEKKLADLHYHPNRLHKMDHVLQKVLVKSSQSELCDTFMQSDDILIEIHYDGSKIHESLSGIGFILELTSGVKLGGYNTYMAYEPPHSIPQVGKAQFVLQSPKLIEGRYFVTVSLGIHQHHLVDKVARAVYFDVLPDDIYGTGFLLTSNMGIVSLQCDTVISGSTS